MRQSDWIGKSIGGRYKIDEILGQGGMSAVFKATDPNLRRVVAIKMIHPHLSHDSGFVRRFEEEAAAVAQLRHPNIIQVYDFNHDNDAYYMVLEFVPGESLQDHLRRLNAVGRQIPIKDVLNYAIEVCEAADYAHQRGLIHRDIKPANVMLSVQGNAILMDFGIAKIIGGQQHTATGAVVGTAMYMSPEQIKGETPDRSSDIYSLGVMLFEMVSGRPPFEADSAMTLMMMHVNDPVPNLFEIIPTCEPDIVAVINKALSKEPFDRFQTAAQMATALKKVLERMEAEEGMHAADFTLSEPPASSDWYSEPEDRSGRTDSEKAGALEDAEVALEGTLIEPPSAASSHRPVESQTAASRDSGVMLDSGRAGAQSQTAGSTRKGKLNVTPALLGGGLVVLIVLICLIAGGAILLNRIGLF